MMRFALVPVFAACGSAAQPLAQSQPRGTDASVPCPTGEALARLAGQLAGGELVGAAAWPWEPYCVAGQFPMPGWVIKFAEGAERPFVRERSFVVDTSGAVVARFEREVHSEHTADSPDRDYRVADFDGDGVDEIFATEDWSHMGDYTRTLRVWRIEGPAWREVLQKQLASGTDASLDCEATYAVVAATGGRHRLDVTPKVSNSERCPRAPERWVLKGAAFVRE